MLGTREKPAKLHNYLCGICFPVLMLPKIIKSRLNSLSGKYQLERQNRRSKKDAMQNCSSKVSILHMALFQSTSGKYFFLSRNCPRSQIGCCWKRPLEVTLSNPTAQTGSPRTGCPWPYTVYFEYTSEDGDITVPLGKLCQCLFILTIE